MANSHNGNRLEHNLEELSWEFVLDLDTDEKGEEVFLEEKEEEPSEEPAEEEKKEEPPVVEEEEEDDF